MSDGFCVTGIFLSFLTCVVLSMCIWDMSRFLIIFNRDLIGIELYMENSNTSNCVIFI